MTCFYFVLSANINLSWCTIVQEKRQFSLEMPGDLVERIGAADFHSTKFIKEAEQGTKEKLHNLLRKFEGES